MKKRNTSDMESASMKPDDSMDISAMSKKDGRDAVDETGFQDYKVEDALRTLEQAHHIKNNPKLLHHVKKLAGTKKRAYTSIADLRARSKELDSADHDSDD